MQGANRGLGQFVYDGDGKRVKSIMGAETILFVGAHYEVKGSEITKYYLAGSTRIAQRKYVIPQSMSVEYFLSDHLGSTSLTTDSAGEKISEIRYKPFGETRYSWTSETLTTTPMYEMTKYQFTGQFIYEAEFGLYFYNARMYDPALGRFTSADTIIPDGVQGLDRYAYTSNNPLRYTDPTGHRNCDEDGYNCPDDDYISPWQQALDTATKAKIDTPNLMWWGLPKEQRAILEAGGWTEGIYEDFRSGGVSQADMQHDPATYIVGAVGTAGLLKAGYTAVVLVGAQLATNNPNADTVMLGRYYSEADNYMVQAGSESTFFNLGNAYNLLDKIGIAQPMNRQFILNQIAQKKDFIVYGAEEVGTNLHMEAQMVFSSGLYTEIGQVANCLYTNFFEYIR